MCARPPNVCPTCGSDVVWPCTQRPCRDMTAPDPWHAPYVESTGDGTFNAYSTIRPVRRMKEYDQ